MKITLKRTSPNYRQKLSTPIIMRDLTIAILALVAFSLYYYSTVGTDYLLKAISIYAVSVTVAMLTEFVYFYVSKKKEALTECRYSFGWVTALIFALTLPIGTPLYVVGVGSFVAIFFGKLIYGGFGQNIFNPALVGRVVVFLSFGSKLVNYLGDKAPDMIASATPTTALNASNWMGTISTDLGSLFTGMYSAALGETCTLLILVCGVVLAIRKVFDWRIPVAYLGTAMVLAAVQAIVSGLDLLPTVLTHLSIGGLAFGAIFMATDPVTSPTSPLGKIIYGISLGFITMLIRYQGNYPEGVLFAILIMNMLTPLIDNLTLGRTDTKKPVQYATIVVMLAASMGIIGGIASGLELPKPKVEKPKVEKLPDYQVLEDRGNGTYLMQAKGFGGDASPMEIVVQIQDGKAVKVNVVKHNGESDGYGLDLIVSGEGVGLNENAKAFYDAINSGTLTSESLDGLDSSTGATITANGIKNAIKGAFEVAPIVDGDNYTYSCKAVGFGTDKNPITLKVTYNKKTATIEKVEAVKFAGETEGYGADLITSGEGEMLNEAAKKFHDVVFGGSFKLADLDGLDTATGATVTTTGIKVAIKDLIPEDNGTSIIYTKTANGFAGKSNPMTIKVYVNKVSGDIDQVEVVKFAGETEGYGADLITSGEGEMLNEAAKKFHDTVFGGSFKLADLEGLDTATGATATTKGIVDAIKQAAKAN